MAKDSCQIEFTAQAEKAYLQLYEDAQICLDNGLDNDLKVVVFERANDILFTIIPTEPFNPNWRMPGTLSKYYRITVSGICVCYLAMPELSKVLILYIILSQRKDCHSGDPYSLLTKMIRDGRAEAFLAQLGLGDSPITRTFRSNVSH